MWLVEPNANASVIWVVPFPLRWCSITVIVFHTEVRHPFLQIPYPSASFRDIHRDSSCHLSFFFRSFRMNFHRVHSPVLFLRQRRGLPWPCNREISRFSLSPWWINHIDPFDSALHPCLWGRPLSVYLLWVKLTSHLVLHRGGCSSWRRSWSLLRRRCVVVGEFPSSVAVRLNRNNAWHVLPNPRLQTSCPSSCNQLCSSTCRRHRWVPLFCWLIVAYHRNHLCSFQTCHRFHCVNRFVDCSISGTVVSFVRSSGEWSFCFVAVSYVLSPTKWPYYKWLLVDVSLSQIE